jgi:hypothetical protein
MTVGTGQNVLIGGFIVQGTQSKTLVLRAIGPSLTSAGVTGVLPDPVLELHDATGAIIASNDDWAANNPQASQIQQIGLAPRDSRESALLVTLPPGNYTVVVSGHGGATGNGLVEAYDIDSNSTRLANISTRGRVGTANEPMIGGLIAQGGAKKVIIRALGPSLGTGSNAITGALADPVLELHDSFGNLLAVNDDWGNSDQVAEILASTIPPVNPLESAIVATLSAGSYTAIVRSVDGTPGVALVEVYDLDP